jgi:tetratricopeptide (TPR) repeat protein
MAESQAALAQALRLRINDASLLRELATCFMASDKLQTAEDLVRRAISLEVAQSSMTGSGRASSLTRKLLGDILATENQVVLAVEEYQRVVADSDADIETRKAAAGKCAKLLSTLGRDEDLRTLKHIMETLNNASRGHQMQ